MTRKEQRGALERIALEADNLRGKARDSGDFNPGLSPISDTVTELALLVAEIAALLSEDLRK